MWSGSEDGLKVAMEGVDAISCPLSGEGRSTMTEPMNPQAQWAPPPGPPPSPPPAPPFAPPQYAPPAQYAAPYGYQVVRRNGLAIASMVVGIVGILMFWLYAIVPIVAIVFGHVALSQIKKRGQEGRGMAIAGIVTGYVGLGLFALVLLAAAAQNS
jgi:hypothetical protein